MAGAEQGFEPGLPDNPPQALLPWVQGSPAAAGPSSRAPGLLPGPRHDLQGPWVGFSFPRPHELPRRPGVAFLFFSSEFCLPGSTVGRIRLGSNCLSPPPAPLIWALVPARPGM